MSMSDKSAALKLLVIDDTPQNLELVAEALAQKGLQILTASDPEAGFELFLRVRPQIVLLDLVMPKVSGMELLERIAAIDPGTDVILMTAHYSPESAVEAIQKGACDYLTKPLDLEKQPPDWGSAGGRRETAARLSTGSRLGGRLSV
jgi:DNA-binding NtrC family response regulator